MLLLPSYTPFSKDACVTWWQNHASIKCLKSFLQLHDAVELCLLAGLCVYYVCVDVESYLSVGDSHRWITSQYIHSGTVIPFTIPLRLSHGKRTSKCRVCWAPGRDIEGALRRRWLVLVLVVMLPLTPASAFAWRTRWHAEDEDDEDDEDEDENTRAAAVDGEPAMLARSRRTMLV